MLTLTTFSFFDDGGNSTWIVIILIIVACAVAVGEISARFIVGANRTQEDGFRAFRAVRGPMMGMQMPKQSLYGLTLGDSL